MPYKEQRQQLALMLNVGGLHLRSSKDWCLALGWAERKDDGCACVDMFASDTEMYEKFILKALITANLKILNKLVACYACADNAC